MVLWVQFSHTDHWMFNMAHHGKELSEDLRIRIVALHKMARGYKFGNTLKPITVQWPGSYRGFPRRVSLEQASQGSIKEVESLWLCIRCRAGFKKQTHRVLPALLIEVAEVEGQPLSVLRPYATHCNKSVCMAIVPEGSFFWSWLTKKPANSCWRQPGQELTGTMSCGLMSLT